MPKKTVKSKKTSKKTHVMKSASKATKKSKKTKKVAPPVVPVKPVTPPATPVAVPSPVPPVKTEAEKIWNEIKNLPIQMFGLPDQIVALHCTFVTVEPSALYLTIRSTATLPSLEAAIGPGFVVDLADKFVIVKRAAKPMIPSKR